MARWVKSDARNAEPDALRVVKAIVGGRRVLFVGVGTTGHKAAVQFKAWLVQLFGFVPAAVRIVVFDVDARREVASVSDSSNGRDQETVALEKDLEFVQLAADLNLERLAVEAERSPALHREALALLRLQPDGRRVRSLEHGAEGEPLDGALGGIWSTGTVRAALRSNLSQLLRLHLDEDSSIGQAVTIFVVGSLAGGCGAPNLLLVAKQLRETLEDAGIDARGALVIEIAVMPEAFPESILRDAVTWATLGYHNQAFASGRLPLASEQTPPGRPFDLSILCSTISETGNTLAGVDELANVVGLATVVLGAYPLREAAAGAWANVFRRMEGGLPTGEPTPYSSLGASSWRFSATEAGDYMAAHMVEMSLEEVLHREASAVEPTVKTVFSAHLADLDALMKRLQHDDNGRPLLGDLATEAARAFPTGRGADKRLVKSLNDMEGTLRQRSGRALQRSSETMRSVAVDLEASLAELFLGMVDSDGPVAGSSFMTQSIAWLDGLINELEGQRETLKGKVEESLTRREDALRILSARPSGRLFRRQKGIKDAKQAYLNASVSAVGDGFALDLIGLVLQSLVRLRITCEGRLRSANELVASLSDLRDICRARQQAFEASHETRRSGVERSLHDIDMLRHLFGDVIAGSWGEPPPDLGERIVSASGPISSWIDLGKDGVAARLEDSAAEHLNRVYSMTVNDYLAWRCERDDLRPELLLRDLLRQAAPLCRYERARLPSEDDLSESTFHLLAVADPGNSIFSDVPDVLLIGTPDSERVTVLTIKCGLPSSALWRAHRYRSAYETIKRQGQVALEYYPDYSGLFDGKGRSTSHTQSSKRRSKGRKSDVQ